MFAVVVSWDRAFYIGRVYPGDGLEIEGHSAVTLGELYSHR